MYRCQDCEKTFRYVEVVFEKHDLNSPPYERIKRCPFCKSQSFISYRELYCGCCGAPTADGKEYCNDSCRRVGEAMKEAEKKKAQLIRNFDVSRAIKEVEEYNRLHKTKLSYGRYFYLKESGKLDDCK